MDPKSEPVDLEEALLRAGRDVRMSPELRNRTLAALGVGAVGLTTATTAKAGTLAALANKPGLLFGAGLVGALGVVGAVAVAGGWFEEDRTAPPAERAAASLGEAPSGETRQAETSSDEPDELRVEVLEAPSKTDAPTSQEPSAAISGAEAPRTEGRGKSRATQAPPAGESASLGEEVAQLGRAESALRGGRPKDALLRLAEYHERFPRPRLGLEAEVLTIQALAESGSAASARARAARFIERHPTSPLGARVKRYVE